MAVTAAVLRSRTAPFELVEVELDGPRAGEVLVRIVAAGMCHTDLSMREPFRDVAFPAVLGHEGAGVVEQVGDGVEVSVGQPVVLSFRSCGRCGNCRTGAPSYCDTMMLLNFGLSRTDGSMAISLDGHPVGSHFFGQSSFATHAVVDARSVVPVADDAPLEIAGPLGCGVQTGAGAVLRALRPASGSAFAVLGSGAVGLSGLLAAVMIGCDPIIAVDRHESRLALARDLGATHTVGADADVTSALLDASAGRGVDVALDTTGVPAVVAPAVAALAPRGTLGTVAARGEAPMTEISLRHLLNGRAVIGIIEGNSVPHVFIPELLAHHQAGRFPFDRLITHYPFDRINDAEAASEDGSAIKPVLLMP